MFFFFQLKFVCRYSNDIFIRQEIIKFMRIISICFKMFSMFALFIHPFIELKRCNERGKKRESNSVHNAHANSLRKGFGVLTRKRKFAYEQTLLASQPVVT